MRLEITSNPNEEDDQLIISKTREYNSAFAPTEFKLLSIYCRNDNGEIVGGLTGKSFWDWLHIEYLWVNESERGKDVGTQIMLAGEDEAINRGCIGSTLDTFSFQALGFYEKLGYSVTGKLSGYLGKYERFYLQKKLGQKI
ncbi:MAG: ribosomal protein S18 acetylase RimI-like enzyme [Paracoccaceae bacterium]|jgi:ribosomal protein S18 acetylase RimI-like enzyme